MKKARRISFKRSYKVGKITLGAMYVVTILAITIFGAANMIGGTSVNPFAKPSGVPVQIISNTPEPAQKSLQLETFYGNEITPTPLITVTPQPAAPSKKVCGPDDDNGVAVPADCRCVDQAITCKGGKAYNDDGTPSEFSMVCGTKLAPSDGRYCVGKPVVYLYPLKPTLVDVGVESAGKVVVSDPHYPEGGWKSVLAYPSGRLQYQGHEYKELFYETEVNKINQPNNGLVIATSDIASQLKKITTIYGLNNMEQHHDV